MLDVDGNILASVSIVEPSVGISILDISNPLHPQILAEYSGEQLGATMNTYSLGLFLGRSYDLRWPYLFFIDEAGLNAADFSDLENPRIVWTYPDPGYPYSSTGNRLVTVRGNHALWIYQKYEIVENKNTILSFCDAFDLDDVRNPRKVASVQFPAIDKDYGLSKIQWDGGRFAYCSSDVWGIPVYRSLDGEVSQTGPVWIVDLSKISEPQIALFEPEERLGTISLAGDFLYIRAFEKQITDRQEYIPRWLSFSIGQLPTPQPIETQIPNALPKILVGDFQMFVSFPEKGGNKTLIRVDDDLMARIAQNTPEMTNRTLCGYRFNDTGWLLTYKLPAVSDFSEFMQYN